MNNLLDEIEEIVADDLDYIVDNWVDMIPEDADPDGIEDKGV